MRDRWKWAGLVAIAVTLCLLTLVGLEWAFGALEPRLGVDQELIANTREFVVYGRSGSYEARPYVLYGPAAKNRAGFADEEWPVARTPGVPRVICLGGSTTEGGNPGANEGSFPFILGAILEPRLGKKVEVFNAGVSGWTTAEMLVAWVLTLQDYRPDVLIVHEAVNDTEPRAWPDFRSDYSHYRKAWEIERFGWVERMLAERSDLFLWLFWRRHPPDLVDVVVRKPQGDWAFEDGHFAPGTDAPYRRNLMTMGREVRALGGELMLATLPARPPAATDDPGLVIFRAGIREHNQIMRDLAREHGFLLSDIAGWSEAHAEAVRPVFRDLVHVEPAGNRIKAERIAETLMARGGVFAPAP